MNRMGTTMNTHNMNIGTDDKANVSHWPIDIIIDYQYPLGGYPVRSLKRQLLEVKRALAAKAAVVAKDELLAIAKKQLDSASYATLSASLLAVKDVLPERLDLGNKNFVQGLHDLITTIDYDRSGTISKRKIKDFAANPPAGLRDTLAVKMGMVH